MLKFAYQAAPAAKQAAIADKVLTSTKVVYFVESLSGASRS